MLENRLKIRENVNKNYYYINTVIDGQRYQAMNRYNEKNYRVV